VQFCAKTVPESFVAMTDKEIDKLFEATDKAFAPLGYSGFEIAVREEAPLFAQIADIMKTLSNRDLARRWLLSLPENESAEFAQLLPLLPTIVYKIREFSPEAVKELPHAPGGRPTVSTPELCNQICEEIGALIIKRVPLSTIYKRLGQRHGLSARTVQRIWNRRKEE
jgi:hypothetical protein